MITPYALEGAFHTITEQNEMTFRGGSAPNEIIIEMLSKKCHQL